MLRPTLLALSPWLAIALARELEGALSLVLHTSLPDPGILAAAVRALDPARLVGNAVVWVVVGALLWMALVAARSARQGSSLPEAAAAEASSFVPLLLIPATTLLAVTSLAFRASWPYGHTLAVALSQDLAPGRDVLAAAAFLALRAPALRLPPPRAGGVFFATFLAYALLTPDWARQWDNHPGNEPKYLRMAVALGHRLSLDVEPVSASMEDLVPQPLPTAALTAARGLFRESGRMMVALVRGPSAVGREAITATRITRQTIRGKEGGVFHVLAPGPSLLLAPTLRIDRALNRAFGRPGYLAVSVLLMNALGALLVTAVFQLARDATGRSGLAATLAFAFALLPPFLFYFFQFYPEMPGALTLAVLFRFLFFRDRLGPRTAWGVGLLLALLPWLHQKFLVMWLVLAVTAVAQAVRRGEGRAALAGLVAPQLVSLYLTALYNFGIAGSVRPDALFLAWGPAGVTTARLGQGLLGLWLDARYGLVPMAPAYVLAAVGLLLPGDRAHRLRRAFPAALVYYLTVAAADNWAGAVCNLGRYLMPILPLVIAFAAVAINRTAARRGALALVLLLFGLTALFARALWLDPHAANDSALLLAKSRFADGALYVPGLFIRTWAAGAPGLWARTLVWLLLVAGLSIWLRRVALGRGGERPLLASSLTLAFILAGALVLERWPSSRTGPVFPNTVPLADGRTVFPEGRLRRQGDLLEVQPGEMHLLVRAPGEDGPKALALLLGGEGLVEWPGRSPLALRAHGVLVDLPLEPVVTVYGKAGARETLLRQTLRVPGPQPVALRFKGALLENVEPEPAPER